MSLAKGYLAHMYNATEVKDTVRELYLHPTNLGACQCALLSGWLNYVY